MSGMVDREIMVYACWLKGRLRYLLRPYQKEVYDGVRRLEQQEEGPPIIFLNLSRQIGKSTTSAIILLEDCIRNPNTFVTFISATKVDAKDIIRKVMVPILDECPPDLKPQWRQDDYAYVFSNGSELAVLGADDEAQISRIRGRPRHKNVVDEARNIRHLENLVESVLIPSMLTTGGVVILSTTPADTPEHKSKDYYEQTKVDNALFEFTIWDAKQSCPDIFTNEVINKLARAYGGFEASAWQREFECKWVVEKTRALTPEWTDEYIIRFDEIPRNEYYPYFQKVVFLDIGYRDFTSLLFGYWNYDLHKLFIEDEWCDTGQATLVENVAEIVKNKEKELWGEPENIFRVSDNNDPRYTGQLAADFDLPFTWVVKSKGTHDKILHGMVKDVRTALKMGQIFVSDRCKVLALTLANGLWDENFKEFERGSNIGHADALAALMYGWRMIDKFDDPVPIPVRKGVRIERLNDPRVWTPQVEYKDWKIEGEDADTLADVFSREYK